MKRPLRVAALVLLICGVAPYVTAADASSATAPGAAAASSCEDKAVDKNGKKLSGAAKTSFMKKCEADAKAAAASSCEDKAVDKNGKKLSGAAKTSFMKKCEADATSAK